MKVRELRIKSVLTLLRVALYVPQPIATRSPCISIHKPVEVNGNKTENATARSPQHMGTTLLRNSKRYPSMHLHPTCLSIVAGLSQICGKSVRSATLTSVKNLQSADSRSVEN